MPQSSLTGNMLSLAFEDYIDARLLIRQNRLLNGGHLSALATEKVLKAIILACGLQPKPVHLNRVDQLVNPLLTSMPDYKSYLNIDFLHYLGRIFNLRYYPDKADDQISISRNKLLWEIDRFFDQVHSTIKVKPKGDVVYSKEKELSNNSIYEGNQWLLGKHTVADLETIPDFLEGHYRLNNGIWLSIRKELPKTMVNCKIGEEVKFSRSNG